MWQKVSRLIRTEQARLIKTIKTAAILTLRGRGPGEVTQRPDAIASVARLAEFVLWAQS